MVFFDHFCPYFYRFLLFPFALVSFFRKSHSWTLTLEYAEQQDLFARNTRKGNILYFICEKVARHCMLWQLQLVRKQLEQLKCVGSIFRLWVSLQGEAVYFILIIYCIQVNEDGCLIIYMQFISKETTLQGLRRKISLFIQKMKLFVNLNHLQLPLMIEINIIFPMKAK